MAEPSAIRKTAVLVIGFGRPPRLRRPAAKGPPYLPRPKGYDGGAEAAVRPRKDQSEVEARCRSADGWRPER